MISPFPLAVAFWSTGKRYMIENGLPSKTVHGLLDGSRTYYSFNSVFGRPAGVAVIGAGGFIGEFIVKHLPAEEANLISVTLSRDSRTAAKQQISGGLRAEQVAKSYDEILNNSKVDVVIIATDNASHFELAQRSLLKGKNVICEKPVGVSVKEAEALHEIAQTQGLAFTLNHLCPVLSCVEYGRARN